jgi:uncharacterized protein
MTAFLTAEWRSLLMLNYEVEAGVLADLVPRGTELDSWNDCTYISIVGFRFMRTRVMGVPIPWHENFEEVNLRFYVRRRVEGAWRRGVVFIKEIVPKPAIALVARLLYNEPYVAAPMRYVDAGAPGSERRVSYSWYLANRWNSATGVVGGSWALPARESEAEFITEHYWGYTRQRDGSSREYQVTHEPWQIRVADSAGLDCDVAGVYGERYAEALSVAPRSVFVAEGSPVAVHRGVATTTG